MNYFFKPFFYFIQFLPSDSYKPFLSWCELFTQLLHSVACGRKGSGLGKDVHDATYSFLVTIKLYGINFESLQNTSWWIYSCCFYLMICVSLFTATLSFSSVTHGTFEFPFQNFFLVQTISSFRVLYTILFKLNQIIYTVLPEIWTVIVQVGLTVKPGQAFPSLTN